MKALFARREWKVENHFVTSWLFSTSKFSAIWLLIRLYLGGIWLRAGIGKVTSDGWVGAEAGSIVRELLSGTDTGELRNVSDNIIAEVILAHASLFSHLIAWSEVVFGFGLFFGMLTGIVAFLGLSLNIGLLILGIGAMTPFVFILSIFLILGWKVVGWYGLDRYVLPKLALVRMPDYVEKSDGKLDSLKYFHYVD